MHLSFLSILFLPTNGSGLGHLTRCLAYARRLRDRAESVFFSLSSAIEFIEEMGFQADYFVSPFWSCSSTYDWNCELAVRFGLMLERTRPDVVVFDGTWPFQGFLAACRAYGRPLKMVWSNRGLLKKDAKAVPVDESLFDLIIQPGELGMGYAEAILPRGGAKVTVPPVTLLDDEELLTKAQARRRLGLEPQTRYALFSLGPGNLKDMREVGHALVRQVQAQGFSIVWACAPISVRDVELPAMVRPVSVYPLARYFRAFDAFVGAAGYNTCCEVAQARIPSLLTPNSLVADDQAARARLLAANAPVVVSTCETERECRAAVLDLRELVENRPAVSSSPVMNGAALAAEAMLRLARH